MIEDKMKELGFTEQIGGAENYAKRLYKNPDIDVYCTARLDGNKWRFRFWRADSRLTYTYTRAKFLGLTLRDFRKMRFVQYTPLSLPWGKGKGESETDGKR